jgi:HEAT repeat protein
LKPPDLEIHMRRLVFPWLLLAIAGCGPAPDANVSYEGVPLTVWLGRLRDPDPSTRLAAQAALVNIGKPAVGGLIKALKDDQAEVRLAAVLALNDIGLDAWDAVPALRQAAASDAAEPVRSCAAEAVGRIETLKTLE